MTLSPLIWIRLEQAATDNGFDIDGPRIERWRTFSSSQTNLRIWLSGDEAALLVALSRWEVFEALEGFGVPWSDDLPTGAAAARSVGDMASLHALIRRAFQLSRVLAEEPLQRFLQKTTALPRKTEVERLVIQRVGQDVFRQSLLDYWEGRCAVTGLAVVGLLRASHIKPWAKCDVDAERLDVFNGFLLSPNLDATFDQGFITFADDATMIISDRLDSAARSTLGLYEGARILKLHAKHAPYLAWHRSNLFIKT
jgi:putative restriction endonuclease